MSGSGNAHPAWEPLLNKIPESLRELVKPVFIEFDNNVQQTLEAKNAELAKYAPFKQFVDKEVDPEWLVEAADLAYMFQENPKAIIDNANKVWNLGYVTPEEAATLKQSGGDSAPNPYGDDDPELDVQDITKHPQFAQLVETLNGLKGQVEEFTNEQQTSRQQQEWDAFLKQQHDSGKVFDDTYVTALVANGVSFDQAYEQYNNLVAQVVGNGNNGDEGNNEQAGQSANSGDSTAPVVMGGDGAGSGLPTQEISFGKMKQSDLEDTVAQMIAQLNQQD